MGKRQESSFLWTMRFGFARVGYTGGTSWPTSRKLVLGGFTLGRGREVCYGAGI